MPLVADGAEGDFLTDVQDVVADTLKVGEHLGVEHAGLRPSRRPSCIRSIWLWRNSSVMSSIFCSICCDFLESAAVLLDTPAADVRAAWQPDRPRISRDLSLG